MKKHIISILALSLSLPVGARVTLPQFFTDSMVVQQQAVITIPGQAKKGATVKITPSWDNNTLKVKAAKDGSFAAQLSTPAAGGPYTITFDDGKQPLVLSDVLVGDVWLCSGQSNMEMPVAGWGKVMNYREEVASANSPDLRLLQIQKQTSYGPKSDTNVSMGGWRPATPETVANFSSIGYFFGRDLQKELGDTPIGIIDCTWGGTPIEAWSAYETLAGINEFAGELETIRNSDFDSDRLLAIYQQRYDDWVKLTEDGDINFDRAALQQDWSTIEAPGIWEDTVLPNFDGVVWLQREFSVPADVAAGEAVLHLSTIDDDDITYINGVEVGRTTGYNVPRAYKIPAGVLRPGSNVISVRVADYQGGGGLWGDAADMFVLAADKKIDLAGVWRYKVSLNLADLPPMPVSPVNSSFPTVLYNAMLHPLTVMPIKGVLWYQGCANVGNDKMYSKAFKAMINDWRKDFNNPDMPFYFVQLAGFMQPKRFQPLSQWAALRQAQADALELPHTGMAVAIDLGNPDDIHPKNKQEVARRLLNIALHNDYGRSDVEYKAPEIIGAKTSGRDVLIAFDGPVAILDGGQGFVVRGFNDEWAVGYARQISPKIIAVTSDEVEYPEEVRYLWADYPEGNVRALNGLPVPPFKVSVK